MGYKEEAREESGLALWPAICMGSPAQKGFVLDLTLCRCCLAIMKHLEEGVLCYHFAVRPGNDTAGPEQRWLTD